MSTIAEYLPLTETMTPADQAAVAEAVRSLRPVAARLSIRSVVEP